MQRWKIDSMDKQIIEMALASALSLLNQELQSVVTQELQEEYLVVIHRIEEALKNLNAFSILSGTCMLS